MPTFTGELRSNEIFAGLFNMIISQRVFGDNIKGTYSSLVDKARVDGTLYGDTKLYYATDILRSYQWGPDTAQDSRYGGAMGYEASNLLMLDRPKGPECQKIVLDKFRQIRLTIDNYLTKQAWMNQGAFTSFNSIMMGWMRDTKRVYDSTLYNTFIGTNKSPADQKSNKGSQNIKITPVSGQNDALTMAEALATLLVDLKDVSRDYNDYKYVRSYDESDFIVVWNAKHYNTLKKIDMPVIFHKDGLLNEFDQEVLPERYFGDIVEATGGEVDITDSTSFRTLIEFHLPNGNVLFPGDLIPEGTTGFKEGEVYKTNDKIAFKVIHKGSVPFMSAFEVGTSFFNPRSLTENHYLTWGYNTLEHLKNYPFITATFGE